MAGIQQYTSSLFVQSGSVAKFESGLEVTESIRVSGVITASGYFDLDGNEITGGDTAEFFAGSGSGVSASNPSSVDTFIALPPDAQNTGQLSNPIFIHTTHSNTFFPNHYAFVKITDEFTTVQSGGLDKSNYNLGTLNPGVYRYLVYGAQTGSGGETHQVYSTVFIKGFVNEAPVVIVPTASAATMSIAHDESVGSLILHFTNSFDPNSADAIAQYTASRDLDTDPNDPSSTQAAYILVMSHSNFGGQAVHFPAGQVLQTESKDTTTLNGLGKDVGYVNTLFFTASVSDYTIVDSSTNRVHYENRFDEETFTITLKDYSAEASNQGVQGVTSEDFKLHIEAPPTASISNIRINFENDGFTGISSNALTHTLLYDRTESLSSASIAELPKEYTSSLIRLSAVADIIPPSTFTPPSNHTASIRIQSSSGDDITFSNRVDKKFSFFRFQGGEKTASFFGNGPSVSSNPTESLGYTSFIFKPVFSNNTQSIRLGANTTTNDLNKIDNIRYGNNNHYQAFTTTPNILTIHNIPNINISDIVVEVESGSWGTNSGYPNLTSSLLYGYTSSLLSSQTQSLLIDKIPTGSENANTHPLYSNYISASVVRLRVRAKITEPFGPDHKPITFTLTGSKDDNSLQFEKVFTFSTHSGTDCINSSSVYSNEAKQRLVGIYTSSWQEFNFPEGIYNFTTQLASSSNAGSTIGTIPTAVVSMSNYGNVELNNLIYETEHSGLTGSGVNDANIVTSTTRSVLYGHEHIIKGDSGSYHGHPSSSLYASHSLFRMRVRGKITEPFGPATSKLDFTFRNNRLGYITQISPLSNAFSINTTSSNVFVNNQLVTVFTSSLIGKDIDFAAFTNMQGPSQQTSIIISGSVTFDEDSTEEFIGTSNLSVNNPTISQIAIIDTPATVIENISYETETFGHSRVTINSTTRSVLYGDPHITNATSASANWENHPSASTYASHSVSRFRVKAKVIEPLGFLVHSSSFTNKWISSSAEYSSSKLDFFTGSTDIENSSSKYDGLTRLVTSYTSSFMGAILSSSVIEGVNYLFTSGNILHEPAGENGFTTASGISSNMLVKDTPQIIVNNICEFEEYGHSASNASDSGVTNTERTVLYGDSHTTNATSGSTAWENHPNSASYASHSVSRARIKVNIIEPLGPAHYKIKNIKTLDGTWETVLAFTGSTDFETSSSAYDGQDRLVTSYTESWKGRAISLDGGNYGGSQVFNLSLNTNFNSNLVVSEENPPSISTTPAQITVNDTPATIIENIIYETETFGGSKISSTSTTRSILYGDPHITNATSSGAIWENHPSASTYASHSVTRFRVKAKVTEPLGYLVHTSSFTNKWISSSAEYSSSKLNFFTGSSAVKNSSSAYDGQDRLVTSYTSSFMGAVLSSSLIEGTNYLFTSGNILHNPLGENGFTTASGISSNILIKDTPATIIEFTPIEIETFGDSNIGISNTNINNASLISRSIRLGQNTTDISSSGIDNFFTASSVSRFRTKVTITEPLGPLHHSSSIRTKFVHLQSLIIVSPSSENVNGPYQLFSTNSANIFDSSSAYDGQDRLVTSYTSSFTGSALKSTMTNKKYRAIFKNTEQAVIHNPIGENSHDYTSTDDSSNLFFVVSKSEGSEASTKIDNIVIEVESGSFNTNIGHPNLTSSILYGFTSSLSSSVTKSLIDDVVGTSHQNYSDYISQSIVRLRIKAKVTEPYGIINNTVVTTIQTSSETPVGAFGLLPFSPPTFNFNPGGGSNYTVNPFSEVVGGDLVQVSHFTSSFVEIRIPSGTYIFTASFDSQGTTEDETISSISTAIVSMSSVVPTRFEDLHYEIEKHGYAGSGSNDVNIVSNTLRTVLFGDDHFISDGTGSNEKGEYFASHVSASAYASQSVARFRLRGKMIEPFGPGTTNSTIRFNITASNYNNLPFGNISITPTTTGTYVNKKLVTIFTSSFESQSIQLRTEDTGANNKVDFHISGNITHNPISLNKFTVPNPSFGTITVKDTDRVNVFAVCEFEGFGYSASNALDSGVTETTRSVLYGDPHITNATSQSTNWQNHLNASVYASHSVTRGRVRAEIIEPVGPLHAQFKFHKTLGGIFWRTLTFHTGSTNFEVSKSFYQPNNKFRVIYTESFNGKAAELSSENYGGTQDFTFTTITRLQINADTENGFNYNETNASLNVIDTPSTIIKDISYETETFGDSKVTSTSTTRSILYGDPHITNATSSGATWETHPNSASYASHSVSRFRVKAKIIEPLGYLHHSSSFENKWISSSAEYSSSKLDFFTGSSVIKNSSSVYDGSTRLVTSYTSSFMGAILSSSLIEGTNYLFTSGNILHNPIDENGFTTASGISSNMLVKDTPATQILNVIYETETFGHSRIISNSTTRSVLYGDPHITNDTSESKVWETHPSASTYASHSVSRFRVRAKIIEPLGYLHHSSSFEENVKANGIYETSSFFDFFTGSSDVFNSSSAYDEQDRLVTSYTTSFHGHILSSSNQNGVNYLFTSGNILHNPENENNFTTASGVSSNMLVKDTPSVLIERFHEFEGFGYSASNASDSGVDNTERTVLYGDAFKTNDGTGSGDTGESWKDHASASIYASHSVSRARLRVKITEPLGYAHDTIQFTKKIGVSPWESINAFTGSTDFETSSSAYDGQDRLVVAYTESWTGKAIELSTDKRTAGDTEDFFFFTDSITPTIIGENGLSLSNNQISTITVKNTLATQITINKIEIGSGSVVANKAEHDNNTTNPNIIKFIPFNSSSTKGNPNELEEYLHPHSLTRFRILADIIEPMGHAHYSVNTKYTYQINNVGTQGEGSTETLITSSTNITASSFYNNITQLVAAYTTSFEGENLIGSHPNFYEFFIAEGDTIHQDSGTEPNPVININNNDSKLVLIVSSSQTDPLQIKDIVVEVESASGDLLTGYGTDRGHNELTSSLLYGYTASLLSSQTQSLIADNITGNTGHPLYNAYRSASIIRYRVKSRIIEPFGSETHLISSSFKARGATGIQQQSVIGEPERVVVNNFLIGDSGNSPGTAQTLLRTLDLGTLDPNFNITKTIRLVSMSIKGDLDQASNEQITNNQGFKIGGVQIINETNPFLASINNYHVILPQNLNQVTNTANNHQGNPVNNIIDLSEVDFPTPIQTESIEMVNGKVGVTMSIDAGVATSYPIRMNAVFEYDVIETEDTTQFEDIMLSPTFSFGENQPTPPDSNLTLSVRSSSISFIEGSDGLPRKTIAYTSSWVELQTPTGSFNLFSSFQSASSTTFISSLDIANSQSANVTMSNTLPTQLVDLKYETEKHGHAGSGNNDVNIVTDTIRTVLYGDPHITNATSASTDWENHPSASTYASHSVSRFRVKGRIIEPFGPATSVIDVNLLLSSSINNSHNVSENAFESINTSIFAVLGNYDSSNKLNTVFTSSFSENVSLTANSSNTANSTENYIASGTINYTSNFGSTGLPGTNTINISTPTTTSIDVIDTAATEIIITKIETETFGESNVGISNNNQNTPGIISRSILYNENLTRTTGVGVSDIFTSSVVTKFRIKAEITEPLGYEHNESEIKLRFDPDGSGNPQSSTAGDFKKFSTNSADIFNSSSAYDEQDRLVTSYTSSFNGQALGASEPGYWRVGINDTNHDPEGENGRTVTGITTAELYFVVSQSFSDITQPTITNFRLEVEKDHSGSGIGAFERHTNVLHGSQSTEIDHVKNATYTHLDSSGSLVSVRVLATIEEPPGDQHNPVNMSIGGHSGEILSIALSTASIHTASSEITPSTATQGLIGKYTSSFFAVPFKAIGFQTDGTLEQKLDYVVSASTVSIDNISTFTTEPPINTHSIVHVTGALSSSTAITIITASGVGGHVFSSSFFTSSDSEKSIYFVPPVDYSDSDGYIDTDANRVYNLKLSQSLITTPPTFTSESNINFNEGHLDIEYTANNKFIDFENNNAFFTYFSSDLSSNPSNGIADLFITWPLHGNSSHPRNVVRKGTITTTVTDLLEGNGVNTITTDIFVIPAPAITMSGDLSMNIDAHPTSMKNNLYFGLLASQSFSHYSGSNTDEPKNPSSAVSSDRILFASTSVGYNYSMSLFTHPNNVAVYSNGSSDTFIKDNIAFNFGDSGSLELKINGNTEASIDLQSNFNPNDKSGNQNISNYTEGGTSSFAKGRLILTKVAPFNNVSQSLFAHGHNFPNGFQAFNASVELDNKVRDGYNFLELIHNISPGHTQSLNVFDWYYNDGIETGSFKPNQTMTFENSPGNEATHSLSGVSYFKNSIDFTSSIGEIYNLANKVYPLDGGVGSNVASPIFITKKADGDGFTVKGDGQSLDSSQGGFRRLKHQTTENTTFGRRGLRFSESSLNFVPTSVSTASLKLEINAGTIPNDIDPIQGKIFGLTFAQNIRNKNLDHDYSERDLFTASIGRFMPSGSAGLTNLTTINYLPSSPLTASFFDEDRRWASASVAVSQALNPGTINGTNNNYSFWTSIANSNYDSNQNINSTEDLQQLFTGELVYPSLTYSSSIPNSVDYSGISRAQQREYYTAISCSNPFINQKTFTVIISGNLSLEADIPLSTQTNPNPALRQKFNQGNINVFVRIPGPLNNNAGTNQNFPGTGWGSVTGTLTEGGSLGAFAKNDVFNLSPFDNGSTNGNVRLGIDFGQPGVGNSQGILLLKVVISGSIHETGSIKQIIVEPR